MSAGHGRNAGAAGLREKVARAGGLLAEGQFQRVLKDMKPFLKGAQTPLPAAYFAGLAHHGLGDMRRARDYLGLAARLDPEGEAGRFARATLAIEDGKPEAALADLLALLKHQPRNPEILNNAALCEKQTGNLGMALKLWSACLAAAPRHVAAFRNLIDTLHGVGRIDEAQAVARRWPDTAIAADPEALAAVVSLDLSALRPDRARARLAAASERVCKHGAVLAVQAQLASIEGRSEEAARVAAVALRARPSDLTSAVTLYELRNFAADPARAKAAALDAGRRSHEALFRDPSTSPGTLLNLGFLLEKQGDIEKAAACYLQGNARIRAQLDSLGVTYPASQFEACARDAEIWAAEWRERRDPASDQERDPSGEDLPDAVFIVGLPRSGTSLLERILNAHPALVGVGESMALPTLAGSLGLGTLDSPAADAASRAAGLDAGQRAAARRAYYEALGPAGQQGIPVDKCMYNSVFAPLILSIFERPLIIQLDRDFADTALSILSKNFVGCYPFNSDLGLLRHYRAQTRRILQAAAAAAPDRVISVRYEDLARTGETGIRDMVAALRLPWDDACLGYRTVGGAVATASRDQVRNPISDASVGRAARFSGLIPGLGEPPCRP